MADQLSRAWDPGSRRPGPANGRSIPSGGKERSGLLQIKSTWLRRVPTLLGSVLLVRPARLLDRIAIGVTGQPTSRRGGLPRLSRDSRTAS